MYRQRLLPAAVVVVAIAAMAGCNKRDNNVPPVNPTSPTAPVVPSPEVSASAAVQSPAASQ